MVLFLCFKPVVMLTDMLPLWNLKTAIHILNTYATLIKRNCFFRAWAWLWRSTRNCKNFLVWYNVCCRNHAAKVTTHSELVEITSKPKTCYWIQHVDVLYRKANLTVSMVAAKNQRCCSSYLCHRTRCSIIHITPLQFNYINLTPRKRRVARKRRLEISKAAWGKP